MQISGQVLRVSNEPEAFLDASEDLSRPVIISGALEKWPAYQSWSPENIAERLGARTFFFKRSSCNAHPDFRATSLAQMFAREQLSFREFFSRISEGPLAERCRYLFTGDEHFLFRVREGVSQLNPELAELWPDVRIPEGVPTERLYSVWAWFSGPGVHTWLHYDNNGCHNLNAQLRGRKRCVLFEPRELPNLAFFPQGGSNPALNCSQIDLEAPDLARFPEFAQARALEAQLEAGELLFIPANYAHAFWHQGEFNSNVNFWWKPEAELSDPIAQRERGLLSNASIATAGPQM
jgi:lysine-specific demethylase 8